MDQVVPFKNEVDLMIEDIFKHWDLNKSGYIEKPELKRCCSELRMNDEKLAITFKELDADGDGKISLKDFATSFSKVCSLFDVTQDEVLNQEVSEYRKFEKLLDAIGVKGLLSGQEYVSELFHYMHNSTDSAQLLSLLESFLFSVVRDVKHYSSENAKLEDALKRTCEKHAEHMEQLDDELDQQMSRMEMRIKKEEKSKFERSNLDMVWQLENKNKEIQTLNTKVLKLEGKLKKKEPEEQKLKEEIEEKVQELRYMRSQVTDAHTTVAVIRSELAQMKNDYEDQGAQLEAEKRTVMECVQEQESLTRQLQLLHEANKKLHDTNDDLRSALEMRKPSDSGRTPSPNKRNSMSTLYSTVPRAHKRSKSHDPVSTRKSSGLTGEFTGDDRQPNSAAATLIRSPGGGPNFEGSRRSSLLLPSQQSCEVDEPEVNEESLHAEFMKVQRINTNRDKKTRDADKTGIGDKTVTSQKTSQSQDANAGDKFRRTKNSSPRFGSKIGEYLTKIKTANRRQDTTKQEIKDKRKLNRTKGESTDRNLSVKKDNKATQEKSKKSLLREGHNLRQDLLTKKAKNSERLTRSESERVNSRNSDGAAVKRSKSSAVTFSSSLIGSRNSRDRPRDRDNANKLSRDRMHVDDTSISETSDTDNTGADLRLNFPDGTEEEEDEAYNTMPSSERESLRQQLDLLQKTNSDLRTALEVVSKARMPSKSRRERGERGDKARRNTSIRSTNSDYGSISSRSMSPNRSQGAKSGEDVADGAEELSGYDPESDGNNTSTLTLQDRHEEAPSKPAKLKAAPRERIKLAGRENNDVIWESDQEGETADEADNRHADSGYTRDVARTPFRRDSILRKPCRHRSLEALEKIGDESQAGKGNRSAWPPIARAGKWHSLEQVRKRNEFAGERTRSLPHWRTQSADRLDFSTGEGLSRLAEKLNALQSSREDVGAEASQPSQDVAPETPAKVEPVAEKEPLMKIEPLFSAETVPLPKKEPLRKTVPLPKEAASLPNKELKKTKPLLGKATASLQGKETLRKTVPLPKETASLPNKELTKTKPLLGKATASLQGKETLRKTVPLLNETTSLPDTELLRKAKPLLSKETASLQGNEPLRKTEPLLRKETVPSKNLASVDNYKMEIDRRAINQVVASLLRPVPAPRKRKDNTATENDSNGPVNENSASVIEGRRREELGRPTKMHAYGSPYGSMRRKKQTESLPDSDISRADLLSAELEAQFKSVKEEDEEDIDEDDLGDEELAQLVAMATGMTDSEEETDTEEDTTVGVREAAIGADSLSEASTNTPLDMSTSTEAVPERMYKLVLAGDAAVGKSSFILRLCRNRFHSALNSTLGVDFQMRTLVVDGKTIALQLWDTAGQERFRSIAKSYFRKADGVLLLYDVTCETSFLDVRDWVEAIEESCSKPVPIMLCGNKTDLRQSYAAENKTVITEDSGRRLAKEHGALFMETSAKENRNITESCMELARMLRDVEDIEVKRNNGMKLTDANGGGKKKSNCCPT